MKKSLFFFLALYLTISNPVNAQKSGFLKKVTKSMSDELLGKPAEDSKSNTDQPEPSCSCEGAELILGLAGNLKLDYTEISITVRDDGSILVKDRQTSKFYIIKDGLTQGPVPEGDSKVAGFENMDKTDTGMEAVLLRFKEYIIKKDEKYLITFGGKSYGPYAQIQNFVVTKPKDKFAAIVIENIIVNEDQGKKMDEAIKNAKSDQERMDLAMQYAQEMQQKMMQGGGPMNTVPKLVTNIPNATLDPMKAMGGTLNGNIKYADILVIAYDKIIDMQGKTVMTIKPEVAGASEVFVNSSNTKYAVYDYGTLTFSDNTTLPELFNPHLVKVDGQIYLAYMYYSPKKNAIMQCKIAF